MTHSVETARKSYQHSDAADAGVTIYKSLDRPRQEEEVVQNPSKRRRFTQEEDDLVIDHFCLGSGDAKKPTLPACASFLQQQTDGTCFLNRTKKDIQDKATNLIRKLAKQK